MYGQIGLSNTLGDEFNILDTIGITPKADSTSVDTKFQIPELETVRNAKIKAEQEAIAAAKKASDDIAKAANAAQNKVVSAKDKLLNKLNNINSNGLTAEEKAAYTHPVSIGLGLAAGVGAAVALYKHRASNGKKGILVPGLVGVVADSIVHYSTAQVIEHYQ